MEYYHDLVTDLSFEELKKLKTRLKFVLIGGWAVWLYTKRMKSKDIDLIVDFDNLSVLQAEYNVVKNDRLKKYEAIRGEVQIDIYVPFYSNLGIPVEDLISRTMKKEGYDLLDVNYLFALKLYTLMQRGRRAKGRKDFIDLLSLFLMDGVDLRKSVEILRKYNLSESVDNFCVFLKETMEFKELGLNAHKFAELKKKLLKIFADL